MNEQEDIKKSGRIATQKDVAERAGVSLSIVSYVINNGPRSVSEETRQRVLKAVDELQYHPNRNARKLISSKWHTNSVQEFGIVLGGGFDMLSNPFYGTVLKGIYQEAQQQGIRIRFTQFLEELHNPVMFNELIHADEVSGLILLAINLSLPYWEYPTDAEPLLQKMRERIPNIVCVERAWGKLPSVIFDRYDAAHLGINHLINLGHERIAFIGAPDERLDSYQRNIIRKGLDMRPEFVLASHPRNSPEEGYKGAQDLLKLPERPTAILAASDEVAIGVLGGLGNYGVSVPEEMAVVGIDDIPLASYVYPPLTTIRVPQVGMGAHAVRLLVERGASDDVGESAISVVLPTELIIRKSCGADLVGKQE